MDARLRDTVSPFLGNFFLLFLQSHPLETLKRKLLPNFSHPSWPAFPGHSGNRAVTARLARGSTGQCARALCTAPRGSARSGNTPGSTTVLAAAMLDPLHGQGQNSITEHMMSRAAEPVWFHLWLQWRKRQHSLEHSIHKGAFHSLSCYGSSLKVPFIFLLLWRY